MALPSCMAISPVMGSTLAIPLIPSVPNNRRAIRFPPRSKHLIRRTYAITYIFCTPRCPHLILYPPPGEDKDERQKLFIVSIIYTKKNSSHGAAPLTADV